MGNVMSEWFSFCPLPFLKKKNKKPPAQKKYEVEEEITPQKNKETLQAQQPDEEEEFEDITVEKIADVASLITPQEDVDFREAFDQVADEDGEVDAYQLREALNTAFKQDFEFNGFTVDMCRSMVAQKDYDMSGQLGYDESKELWADIIIWRNAFLRLDIEKKGYIDASKLDTLLNFVGVKVAGKTAKILLIRYSNKEGHISFEDFISCMLKLKTMTETYREQKSHGQTDKAQFSIDEFIQMTVYC